MNFSVHQASHIGNRKFNQDRVAYAYSNEALLLVLADGMGGHLHGELAATLTIETFVESFGRHAQPGVDDPQKFISATMSHAHERIMRLPHNQDMGGFPGTTCAAALIQDGRMYWGHAGDSRVYLLRDGEMLIRTNDHSLVQHWVESGLLSAEDARTHPQRNQITNCIGGIEDTFYAEMGQPVPLQPGDVVLLSSDGLWGAFSDGELVDAFTSSPIAEVLDGMVSLALERGEGHSDNITGLAVRWGYGEAGHDTAEPVSHVLEIR
jgi:serine/threonine protein phosphatase PrpC